MKPNPSNPATLLFTLTIFVTIGACSPKTTVQPGAVELNQSENHEEGYVKSSDDLKIYYRILGTAPDTVIVLHGGPSHLNSMWLDIAPLSRQHTVIFYDQRGGGRSQLIDNPSLLTWEDHVRDLEAVRQHFGINRLKLFGWSWGSALAGLYAHQYPDHVERMLLSPMGPRKKGDPECAYFTNTGLDSTAQTRLRQLRRIWKDAEDIRSVSKEYWDIVLSSYYVNTYHKIKSDFSDEPPEALRTTWDVWNANYNSLGDYDFRPMLREINVPILIVSGHPSNRLLKCFEWAQSFPNSRLFWLKDAGHPVWIAEPDLLFPAAHQFFAGEWPDGSEVLYEQAVH